MLTRVGFMRFLPFVVAMATIVVLSNFLVQFPVQFQIASLQLADLLTWGAFTYPLAFLITDLTNRHFGPVGARAVVMVGFVIAVALSFLLATPRIAIASGIAFFLAQMLDVSVFNRLRNGGWWKAPLISSFLGSVLDTTIFFTLAFALQFAFLGAVDSFVSEDASVLGVFPAEMPRWMSWAIGDFVVKILVAVAMLMPYGMLRSLDIQRPD